ncbi:MAG: hypothetical protein M1828_004021 [Chrysothrix sp. TS-e1954]|nr:MAG: hypothetical protein M1828_004021 [Chrysothrix sp. TS-e1954]
MAPMHELWAQELQTERLRLIWHDHDNEVQNKHFLATANDPVAIARMGDFGLRTKQDMLGLSHNRALPKEVRGPNAARAATYIVHLGHADDAPMIGLVNLWQGSTALTPDIGWSLLNEYAGHGYATEASRRGMKYWHEECGIPEIAVTTDVYNKESIRIAEKLGYELNGVVTGHHGKPENVFTLPGTRKYSEEELASFFAKG